MLSTQNKVVIFIIIIVIIIINIIIIIMYYYYYKFITSSITIPSQLNRSPPHHTLCVNTTWLARICTYKFGIQISVHKYPVSLFPHYLSQSFQSNWANVAPICWNPATVLVWCQSVVPRYCASVASICLTHGRVSLILRRYAGSAFNWFPAS